MAPADLVTQVDITKRTVISRSKFSCVSEDSRRIIKRGGVLWEAVDNPEGKC